MSAQSELKKSVEIKTRALSRLVREFQSYRKEVEEYNMAEVSQSQKQAAFYEESKAALAQVETKVVEFYQQLRSFLVENEESLKS